MKYLFFAVFTLVIASFSCSDHSKKSEKEYSKPSFESMDFEIFIQAKRFKFRVDSSGIFFLKNWSELATYYGILPDSIFEEIQRNIIKIQNDTTIKSTNDGCADCAYVGVLIISKEDTINIRQNPGDSLIWEMTNPILSFKEFDKYPQIELHWEGADALGPPPMLKKEYRSIYQ